MNIRFGSFMKAGKEGCPLVLLLHFSHCSTHLLILLTLISPPGFEFSKVEPSALVQKQGGPCAVIAPVQAYLLKIIIMDLPGIKLSEVGQLLPLEYRTALISTFIQISLDKSQNLLIQALCDILKNCRAPRYRIVHLLRRRGNATEAGSTKKRSPAGEEESALAGQAAGSSEEVEEAAEATPASVSKLSQALQLEHDMHQELSPDEFHERLHTLHFKNIAAVARYYMENYDQLAHTYGVLLFMYSVFLTKGLELVAADISDTSEPLIHSTYGYGGQSLINLMLTGRAVAHVWDNEQDVGGLKLRGICEQSDIGFITLMEEMRYCTVGSFFKNPRYPVWVMGSDTHLTGESSNNLSLLIALYAPSPWVLTNWRALISAQFCSATKRGLSHQRRPRKLVVGSSNRTTRRATISYRPQCCAKFSSP